MQKQFQPLIIKHSYYVNGRRAGEYESLLLTRFFRCFPALCVPCQINYCRLFIPDQRCFILKSAELFLAAFAVIAFPFRLAKIFNTEGSMSVRTLALTMHKPVLL